MHVIFPTLVVLAEKDTVNPPEQGLELYNAIKADNKHLHIEEGARHYDMYQGDHFNHVVNVQTAWYKTHL